MKHLDIRIEPRHWTADEFHRHDELPGRLDLIDGRLCVDDAERLLLLGALLEHVGTARAVQLGPLKAWADAVAERQELKDWDSMPAVGREQFWKPSALRLSFKHRLELKQSFLNRRTRRQATRRR